MADHDLEAVRADLRRLGYLTRGVERFLLQDALRPRARAASALRLVARVAVLGGPVTALPMALLLAAANGNLERTPADVLPLFLHLLLPASLLFATAFLVLAGAAALTARAVPRWSNETAALAVTVGAGIGVGFGLIGARNLFAHGEWLLRGLLVLVTAVALAFLARVVYDGLLANIILLTERAPRRDLRAPRWFHRALAATAAIVLVVPALVPERGAPGGAERAMPSAPGERVLLIGVDGVLPGELEYLLAHGDLPELERLRAAGGVLLRYERPAVVPAAFWTTVATGLASPRHGVAALDTLRPVGVATPLARTGELRPFFASIEVPLGLAEYRPMLANRRSAHAIWELAARGGRPILAVNWWATFPAEPLPGLVVAHGAYQLLAEGSQSAVWPPAEIASLSAQREAAIGVAPDPSIAAALSPEAARELDARALAPDRFHRAVWSERLAAGPRAAALYLPGLDLAADGWEGNAVAWSDLVRDELQALDRVLAAGLDGVGTLALVLDPGRRGGLEGRVLLWRAAGCAGGEGVTQAEAVAPALLAALGMPRSRELPPPPAACVWPEPPAILDTYGPRRSPGAEKAPDAEYLESLRSLGYL